MHCSHALFMLVPWSRKHPSNLAAKNVCSIHALFALQALDIASALVMPREAFHSGLIARGRISLPSGGVEHVCTIGADGSSSACKCEPPASACEQEVGCFGQLCEYSRSALTPNATYKASGEGLCLSHLITHHSLGSCAVCFQHTSAGTSATDTPVLPLQSCPVTHCVLHHLGSHATQVLLVPASLDGRDLGPVAMLGPLTTRPPELPPLPGIGLGISSLIGPDRFTVANISQDRLGFVRIFVTQPLPPVQAISLRRSGGSDGPGLDAAAVRGNAHAHAYAHPFSFCLYSLTCSWPPPLGAPGCFAVSTCKRIGFSATTPCRHRSTHRSRWLALPRALSLDLPALPYPRPGAATSLQTGSWPVRHCCCCHLLSPAEVMARSSCHLVHGSSTARRSGTRMWQHMSTLRCSVSFSLRV
jgi:hypothetical protein